MIFKDPLCNERHTVIVQQFAKELIVYYSPKNQSQFGLKRVEGLSEGLMSRETQSERIQMSGLKPFHRAGTTVIAAEQLPQPGYDCGHNE